MQLEVRINLILHATENEKKILEKLEDVFGIEQKNFQIEEIPGHFNNPIILISSKLKKKSAENFLVELLKCNVGIFSNLPNSFT